MKTSILVLGNSHVAALRRAWADISKAFPEWEMQFFAANSKLFNQFEMDKTRVFGVHDESRYTPHQLKFLDQVFGRRTIDLKTPDIVLVVGRNSNEVDFQRQFEPYGIDGLCEAPDKPSLSYAAFSRFCHEIALKRLPDPMWHNWDEPRVAFLPAPIPCADCPEEDPRYDVWARYGADPLRGLAYLKTYRAHVEALYREYGITLLSPPDEVYDDSGLTRVEFGEAPIRLHPRAGEYEPSDFHHMNTDYGKVVLRHVLKTLGDGPG